MWEGKEGSGGREAESDFFFFLVYGCTPEVQIFYLCLLEATTTLTYVVRDDCCVLMPCCLFTCSRTQGIPGTFQMLMDNLCFKGLDKAEPGQRKVYRWGFTDCWETEQDSQQDLWEECECVVKVLCKWNEDWSTCRGLQERKGHHANKHSDRWAFSLLCVYQPPRPSKCVHLVPGMSGKKRDPLLCFCITSQSLISSELLTPDTALGCFPLCLSMRGVAAV